jgi:putative heme-binding domain-containing protein
MINFHGRRLNNDMLERQGSGYVARHAADFLKSGDPWFRGLELLAAADGGVYVADWSDTGECHGADGVHLDSGRIYKVVYGHPSRPGFGDLARLSNSELVALQVQKNDWYVRQSRRILYERSAAGLPMDAVHTDLRRIFATDSDPIHQLRALWCLYVTGGASDDWLRVQLHHSDEHVRVWAIRLLGNGKSQPAQFALELSKLAARDSAGLVLLYLASALEKLPLADRWPLATALAARSELATDRVLPLMIWYGIEPTVPENPDRALQLVESTQMLPLVRCVARRLTEDLRLTPRPVDGLVRVARQSRRLETTRAILSGIAEALRGWRHAAMPPSWKTAQSALESSPDLEIRRLTRELAAVFGDGRALDDLKRIASSKRADPAARRDAVRVLVEAQAPGLQPLLCRMLDERELGPDAARSLAVCDDPQLPQFLLGKFAALKEPTQDAVIVTLCARPASARLLLGAVESGAIACGRLPAFQVRQMAAFPDADVRQKIAKLWPELKTVSAAKRKRIEQLKGRLEPAALTAADPIRGRRRFIQTCAACHTLFGQGGKIGPDLTGSQRTNLDYLLENIVDPSAIVAPPYRMSTIALADGRVLNGIVVGQSGSTLTLQTPTERSTVNRADVESIRKSDLSLMPDGLLDVLPEKEVRDLVAYLMSPQQVSLQTEQFSGERHDSQGVR